jgi:hypothetical protein
MQTSDILKKINIPRHKLYYLEQKGYIKPKKITSKRTGDGFLWQVFIEQRKGIFK